MSRDDRISAVVRQVGHAIGVVTATYQPTTAELVEGLSLAISCHSTFARGALSRQELKPIIEDLCLAVNTYAKPTEVTIP